jgi:hypothetical protein
MRCLAEVRASVRSTRRPEPRSSVFGGLPAGHPRRRRPRQAAVTQFVNELEVRGPDPRRRGRVDQKTSSSRARARCGRPFAAPRLASSPSARRRTRSLPPPLARGTLTGTRRPRPTRRRGATRTDAPGAEIGVRFSTGADGRVAGRSGRRGRRSPRSRGDGAALGGREISTAVADPQRLAATGWVTAKSTCGCVGALQLVVSVVLPQVTWPT